MDVALLMKNFVLFSKFSEVLHTPTRPLQAVCTLHWQHRLSCVITRLGLTRTLVAPRYGVWA